MIVVHAIEKNTRLGDVGMSEAGLVNAPGAEMGYGIDDINDR